MTAASLSQILSDLDGQSYGRYRDLVGDWYELDHARWSLIRAQSDPFAPPSVCWVQVPQSIAQFPQHLWSNSVRAIALRDYLTRQFGQAIREMRLGRDLEILVPGQAILVRSAVWVSEREIEVRFRVNLPAVGRRIAGRRAVQLITQDLPKVIARSLHYGALDAAAIAHHIETAEDTAALRSQLVDRKLVAFIGDGSMLARRSGIDDRPDTSAIAFQSPIVGRITLDRPNAGPITGLGIESGVTLIVGGGYHGKSTLLQAIERGIYNHVPSDGRENVVTAPQAMKIRAEDGRSVRNADLSALINHLPQGRSSQCFSTENASGSTSQAANLVEAVAAGATVLLMDEDTCATNLMIRDGRMQQLIAAAQEPITPLIDKVRPLYEQQGVSTILVMGGCGDYLAVADRVIAMQDFQPRDVTDQAREIVAALPEVRQIEGDATFGAIADQRITCPLLTPTQPRKPHRGKIRGAMIQFHDQEVDLAAVSQLIEPGQLKTLAATIVALDSGDYHQANGSLSRILAEFTDRIQSADDLDAVNPERSGELVEVRALELAAALHRLRASAVAQSMRG
jgi:predicted ABC-class ATPase